jgi:putative heme iron utilization protein
MHIAESKEQRKVALAGVATFRLDGGMSDTVTPALPAVTARRLIRSQATATLATSLANGGWPYASLVLTACDHNGSPLLLISALAEHTKNIASDARVSLLFDGTVGLVDRLTGARATVLGRAERSDEPRHRARFLARHPGAALYADFRDFAFYRIAMTRAHLVAGFGRIHWVEGSDLTSPATPALAEAEAGIVRHMNQDHADAVQLYAAGLLGRSGGGWIMTGCDPEGCDIARDGENLRLEFDAPVADAEGARAALVGLVKRARVTLVT